VNSYAQAINTHAARPTMSIREVTALSRQRVLTKDSAKKGPGATPGATQSSVVQPARSSHLTPPRTSADKTDIGRRVTLAVLPEPGARKRAADPDTQPIDSPPANSVPGAVLNALSGPQGTPGEEGDVNQQGNPAALALLCTAVAPTADSAVDSTALVTGGVPVVNWNDVPDVLEKLKALPASAQRHVLALLTRNDDEPLLKVWLDEEECVHSKRSVYPLCYCSTLTTFWIKLNSASPVGRIVRLTVHSASDSVQITSANVTKESCDVFTTKCQGEKEDPKKPVVRSQEKKVVFTSDSVASARVHFAFTSNQVEGSTGTCPLVLRAELLPSGPGEEPLFAWSKPFVILARKDHVPKAKKAKHGPVPQALGMLAAVASDSTVAPVTCAGATPATEGVAPE